MKYNGSILINGEIELNPYLSIDEFKRTKLYDNNDLSKFFWVKKDCLVKDKHFIIGLWFKDRYLKQIQLYYDDANIIDESQRKLMHDKFLHSITNDTKFEWGSINSITSSRDGLSTIVITYK